MTLTFTVTEEMAEYYCSVHPAQMRGSVATRSGDSGGGDGGDDDGGTGGGDGGDGGTGGDGDDDGGTGGDDGGNGGDDGGSDGGDADRPPAVVDDARPTDPDGDGVYEDVNGDGETTFADVVDLFENSDDPAVQNHPDAYDANGNGRFDFQDFVALFRSL